MNPLDIYKRLPRINCGECSAGRCMAFAVKLSSNEAEVSECIKINNKAREELIAMLSSTDTGDWKERFLEELLEEVSRLDLASVALGIGATLNGDSLIVRFMGRDVVVRSTCIEDELDIWDKLLILMYVRNAGNKPLSGRWVAFRDLKDGSIKSEAFRNSCEKPIANAFNNDKEGLLKRLYSIGAEDVKGFSTEYSYVLHPLPKIPFLILLWPKDEDFEATCSVLLDSTATDYLDVEALTFLGQALVRAIRRH